MPSMHNRDPSPLEPYPSRSALPPQIPLAPSRHGGASAHVGGAAVGHHYGSYTNGSSGAPRLAPPPPPPPASAAYGSVGATKRTYAEAMYPPSDGSGSGSSNHTSGRESPSDEPGDSGEVKERPTARKKLNSNVGIKSLEIKGDGDGTTEEEGDEVSAEPPPPSPCHNNPSA